MARIGRGCTFPTFRADAESTTQSNQIIPSASSESDIIPFSPTSSHSSRSDANSRVIKEYTPSLLRVPSSSSEYSNASSACSSKGSSHVRRNTTGTIHLKEIPCSFNIDSTIEVSILNLSR